MPAHFDEPEPATAVDPLGFFVRGWFWLENEHAQIVSAEAWSDDVRIGETRALSARPDVTASLKLSNSDRLGFELFAHHPTAKPSEPFRLELRARRADGTLTPVLE